jgi:UrcA family protein
MLLLAGAICAELAVAAIPENSRPASVRVRYDDVDLSTSSGVATLKRRVRDAARQVCAMQDNPGDPILGFAYRRCVLDASDKALSQVGLKD